MNVNIKRVFQLKDDYQEVFKFSDKEKAPEYSQIHSTTKIIANKERDNIFIFDSHTSFLIETNISLDNEEISFRESISPLGFFVNDYIDYNNKTLMLKLYNFSDNVIYLDTEAELGTIIRRMK